MIVYLLTIGRHRQLRSNLETVGIDPEFYRNDEFRLRKTLGSLTRQVITLAVLLAVLTPYRDLVLSAPLQMSGWFNVICQTEKYEHMRHELSAIPAGLDVVSAYGNVGRPDLAMPLWIQLADQAIAEDKPLDRHIYDCFCMVDSIDPQNKCSSSQWVEYCNPVEQRLLKFYDSYKQVGPRAYFLKSNPHFSVLRLSEGLVRSYVKHDANERLLYWRKLNNFACRLADGHDSGLGAEATAYAKCGKKDEAVVLLNKEIALAEARLPSDGVETRHDVGGQAESIRRLICMDQSELNALRPENGPAEFATFRDSFYEANYNKPAERESVDPFGPGETTEPYSIPTLRLMTHRALSKWRHIEAAGYLEEIVRQEERDKNTDRRQLSWDLMALAICNIDEGRSVHAESICKKSIDIQRTLKTESPTELARNLNNLGGLYFSEQKYAEAAPLYEEALQIDEKRLSKNHPAMAIYHNHLADVYMHLHKYDLAEKSFWRALEIDGSTVGESSPDFARDLANLASVYAVTNRQPEAENLYRKSLRLYQMILGKNGYETINTQDAIDALNKNKSSADKALTERFESRM